MKLLNHMLWVALILLSSVASGGMKSLSVLTQEFKNAIATGNIDWIDRNIDPDNVGPVPHALNLAICSASPRRLEMVARLLALGADVNAVEVERRYPTEIRPIDSLIYLRGPQPITMQSSPVFSTQQWLDMVELIVRHRSFDLLDSQERNRHRLYWVTISSLLDFVEQANINLALRQRVLRTLSFLESRFPNEAQQTREGAHMSDALLAERTSERLSQFRNSWTIYIDNTFLFAANFVRRVRMALRLNTPRATTSATVSS